MSTNPLLMTSFDVNKIRKDFPVLHQKINEYDLVYFDNAATTQKPKAVIDAIAQFYEKDNSNVHRGVHALSVRATEMYEAARAKVKRFINARSPRECIFVRGTTEAINLVAQSLVAPRILPDEEILITHMEHHSNIVPWQMVCKKMGCKLQVAPISLNGEVILEEFERKLNENTKMVAINYASNSLGTINPVKTMIKMAHEVGAKVLLDGAQATAHLIVDVQDLDCDFYAFSGHKMYGPTGIGVLWGKEELLNSMTPYQGGGEMINSVSFDATEYAAIPQKFEAGTPNIAGAIGLAAAIDYIWSLDLDAIAEYEAQLLNYATKAIESVKGYNIIGTAANKVPIISFVHGKIHAHDIGTILDSEGIAIRSGHHCTMPLMDFYDVAATSRISMSFYNTFKEIDYCMEALQRVKEVFA
ncbi:TPA: SufS family cysteine desulfurase [Legionella pneumophila]|uniref:aminotransferase class V-fold PLP-dependent enzyme n=1 Tax=Legionella sp. PATHC032 TaxID=2992039 RepID=UPI000D04D1B0|nr:MULTISPECIES: SufS family cysteine desulfurase [Legionella]MDW8880383.1 SufS family cysteine desulfurase [Legionella pneumophila subsp. fraseri]MCW8420600.1 SufS family cysteine desulfurase [Legionella sp. PATHC032]MDW8963449.1 SufS family cysteine desulfurase [Legionella pneumophila subsp. fraseri]MDW9037164.1 SufS family cysteine desulfurase [Legionella pneumophila subsp. fraseri]MDW9040201.1 SufS family cysteine desulfurase [Legionella pneumophila subsp. fraseri]